MKTKFWLTFLPMAAALAAGPGYHVVDRISLGGEGGWDYITVDSAAHRLYVSHSTRVMVVNLDTGKPAGQIADTLGVHGVALAPELGRGFTSNGGANTSTIFDLKTLAVLGQVKTGTNPDCILYDAPTRRVFTFNGRSGDATAFDAASGEVAGTISLGGKPEFAVSDGSGRIYANIEDKSEVVEIDSRKLAVLRRFPLAPCEEPSGLALDGAHGRLFSVCRNRMMAILDTTSGRVLTTVPIGQGVDGAGFDAGLGLAFASNGEGTLTVVREAGPGKFEVVENAETQRGARTMVVDPATHKIYLPTAKFGPPPPPTQDRPHPRPAIVEGSFEVLVVGR